MEIYSSCSPNFGGLWEATIKSFKTHLKRVAANCFFTYEEFHTLIVQIEGILNSRPLTVLSSDPSDPLPLTPGHFLTGGPIESIVEIGETSESSSMLVKWERIYAMVESFWQRFSLEYIHTLQLRLKWKESVPNLKIGDIVLVADDYLHSTQWLMGRIEKLYTGVDNKVRVVDVKTKIGVYKRSVSKLCKLPI